MYTFFETFYKLTSPKSLKIRFSEKLFFHSQTTFYVVFHPWEKKNRQKFFRIHCSKNIKCFCYFSKMHFAETNQSRQYFLVFCSFLAKISIFDKSVAKFRHSQNLFHNISHPLETKKSTKNFMYTFFETFYKLTSPKSLKKFGFQKKCFFTLKPRFTSFFIHERKKPTKIY